MGGKHKALEKEGCEPKNVIRGKKFIKAPVVEVHLYI